MHCESHNCTAPFHFISNKTLVDCAFVIVATKLGNMHSADAWMPAQCQFNVLEFLNNFYVCLSMAWTSVLNTNSNYYYSQNIEHGKSWLAFFVYMLSQPSR